MLKATSTSYEAQLAHQKEIQFLEERIRQMQGEQDKLSKLDALQRERVNHYREFGSLKDLDRRDTAEDAERGSLPEDGTWEHRKRAHEMLKTAELALAQTKLNAGKHFIGDFLPKDQLEKFKREAECKRLGIPYVEEDFEANKIKADNVGFALLQKAGWEEGKGLGAEGQGRAAPINATGSNNTALGVGAAAPHKPAEGDDSFEEFRKRMMLSYRFRPNPMNNPRRSYY